MTDAQISKLFARQEQLERELATVRARIHAARPVYAARNGLLAYPSFDNLRKAVSS